MNSLRASLEEAQRMADDLEAAAQRRRKMNKSKKVKKVKEQKSKEGLTA